MYILIQHGRRGWRQIRHQAGILVLFMPHVRHPYSVLLFNKASNKMTLPQFNALLSAIKQQREYDTEMHQHLTAYTAFAEVQPYDNSRLVESIISHIRDTIGYSLPFCPIRIHMQGAYKSVVFTKEGDIEDISTPEALYNALCKYSIRHYESAIQE
jgi:hypothetical protein